MFLLSRCFVIFVHGDFSGADFVFDLLVQWRIQIFATTRITDGVPAFLAPVDPVAVRPAPVASTKTITIESDPNGKIIQKTDASPYLKGLSWGNSSKTVESKMGGKATHPYGDISTYNNVKFMGYDSELNFTYIYDELSDITYYQGKSGLEDNYFVVYGDIFEGLVEDFGVPNEHFILSEGIEVDWDVPQQLLIQGIEDGDYNIRANWFLPDASISMFLYKANNGKILIETTFFAPLRIQNSSHEYLSATWKSIQVAFLFYLPLEPDRFRSNCIRTKV